MSSGSTTIVVIGDTFGALFIGALIAMAVYGITTLQTYFYYMSFPKDDIAIKLLVGSIWILDTLHVVFMCHALYFYLILGFGNPQALVDGTWTLLSSIGVNVIVSFIAQCFFTERIFQLCPPRKRWWVTGIIWITVLAHLVFGMETVVFLFIKKEFSRFKEVTLIAAVPFGICAVISDILIAVALCVLLGSNRSAFQDTNNIINKLIIFAINRCILTSAVAVAETIIFSVLPNSFYSVAMDFIIGKLYANSLLAVLNSRVMLDTNSRDASDSTELSTSFHASAVAHHQNNILSQVRTRESNRVPDTDKGNRHMITMESNPPTLNTGRSLEKSLHV